MNDTTATTDTTRSDHTRPPSRRRRRIIYAIIGLVVLTVAAMIPTLLRALAQDGAAEAVVDVDTIGVDDDRFTPPAIEVPVGSTVEFEWIGDSSHDVEFEDGEASPVQREGTWSRTFDEPGSYPFTCSLHAFMDGRIDVTD